MTGRRDADASTQARGAGVNLLTLIAQAAMPAFHVQLAQLLGRASYGLYVWANTVVEFGSAVTLFGMDIAVAREVALAREANDDARAIRAVATGLRLVLFTGLAVTLILGFGASTIAARAHMAGVEVPLRVLTLVPIAYHATTIFIVATQSRGVMKYDFWTRGIVQPLGLLIATTVLLRLGWGLFGAGVGVASAMVLTTCVAAFGYSRVFSIGATLRALVTGPMDREVLKTGLPMTAIALLWSLQGRLDNTVLGATQGAEASGAYGACMLYAITIGQMRSVFVPGLNAALPAMLIRDDRPAMNALIHRTQRWVALLTVPLLVLFAVFGRDLLTVFGKGFPDAAPALALLSVAQLLGAMSIPAQTIVVGSKRGASVVAAVASLGTQVVLLPILCRRYGMVGAATASMIGMFIAQVVQQVWAYRLYGVHGFSWALGRVYLAGLVAAVPGKVLLSILPLPPFPRFVLSVAGAAIVFVGAVVLLGLGKEEREWIISIRATLRRRLAFGRGPKA
ncbi:polysaccharide biosynthesis C-terminal domain-containing protein [soil metagenome]